MNKCLLIIDPQKDFINSEGFYALKHPIKDIVDTKERISGLIRCFKDRIVIISSDYVKNQFGKGILMCIPYTDGHIIDIDYDKSVTTFTKRQHSCFTCKEFALYLKDNNISHLLICGFLAEYCVKESVSDALQLGYKVTLLDDCISTGDDVISRKKIMIKNMLDKGADSILSSEIY